MKHAVEIVRKAQKISGSDLEVGQIGTIVGGHVFNGELLLRTYSNYVLLTDPSNTWEQGSGFTVEPLQVGDQITITVDTTTLSNYKLIEALKRGNKILAIKARREQTNEGLKEAKDYVDKLTAKLQAAGTLPTPLPTPSF
jgi:hypothetical protein